MSGITTGTGIFSGINTAQLIDQLIQASSGPKMLAQQRVLALQVQQAAWLDLNSKVQALQTAAGAFRVDKVFQTNKANSSDPTVLSATASNTAVPGTYQFVVDRLVSTQQYLSRGFANSTTTGLNAGSFTFESAQARLDRDTALADLNGGNGISRGKIVITDATNNQSATIDLSRVGSVQDVLDAINGTAGINVTASVQGGKFVIKSNVGGNISVTNGFGSTTATSLGIERTTASSSTVTGSEVYSLGTDTSLGALNDGNGVTLNSQSGNARYDFQITVGGTAVNINIGDEYDADGKVSESAPTTLGGVLTRINDQLATALGDNHVQAGIGADGVSLAITDSDGRNISVAENATAGSHTAADLGILSTSPQVGTVLGQRILAGLNSTLARTLNGGSGIAGDGTVSITGRDGTLRTVNIDTGGSLQDVIDAFNNDPSHAFSASLNANGTGIAITDLTGGTSNLIISGTTATSLGIATDPAGVASATVNGSNLQHQYITTGTLLSSLRNGQGVGIGSFTITDSNGTNATVNVDASAKTLDDVIRNINSRGTRIKARINDKGDGILLYEDTGGGANKITVSDTSGTVAANLNIAGTAAGTGAQNILDGSAEKKVTFDPTDTLQQIADKINAAGAAVTAGVVNDGAGSAPFRLSLTSKFSGSAGRFIVDTGSFNLGTTQLDDGHDARVFYGSSDPARGVLLSSSTNTLDNVISGVSIDLNGVPPTGAPTTLTISRDTDAIETAINTFVSAFNTLTSGISDKTKYDQASNTKGPLLGDSTALQVQSSLFNAVQGAATGLAGPFQRLSDVGITIGDNGQLKFDTTRFRDAMQQDPQAVADLFSARVQDPAQQTGTIGGLSGVTFNDPNAQPHYSTLGVGSQLELLAMNMLDPVNGTLTQVNNTLNDQITLQTKRITDLQAQLDNQRAVLQQQFLAMEEAIGQLQQQQQSLGSIGQLGG